MYFTHKVKIVFAYKEFILILILLFQALIVPAFEVKGEIANYPQTKDDLLKDLHTNKIEPFL